MTRIYRGNLRHVREQINKLVSATSIGDLSDVSIVSASGGDLLQWDAVDSRFENVTLSVAFTNALTDPGADRLFGWDDSASAVAWLEPGSGLSISGTAVNVSLSLDDITDVDAPSPTDGQVLTWVDANNAWEAADSAGGGGGGSIVTVTGAGNYTVTDANDGDVIVCDTPTRGVRFVDCGSSVSVNTRIRIVREGEGRVQFRGTGGDVVRSPSGVDPLIVDRYGFGYCVKIAAGQWRAEGQGLAPGTSYLDLQPYSSDNMNLTI